MHRGSKRVPASAKAVRCGESASYIGIVSSVTTTHVGTPMIHESAVPASQSETETAGPGDGCQYRADHYRTRPDNEYRRAGAWVGPEYEIHN